MSSVGRLRVLLLGTGDIDPIFIDIGDFDEIPPFGSVDFDPFEIFQVEIVSVEPEKSVTAEIGHVASGSCFSTCRTEAISSG